MKTSTCTACGGEIYRDPQGVWHHNPPVPRHIAVPQIEGETGTCTADELVAMIREQFPDGERDVILYFKIKGRPFNVEHGQAISTTEVEGPRPRRRP